MAEARHSALVNVREVPPGERTIVALLERQAGAFGDRRLVQTPTGSLTYREARDVAARRGGSLRRAGVEAGDRVATMCDNRLEILVLVLGCAWIGATAVPLNTAIRGAQLRHALHNSGARFLMMEPEHLPALDLVEPPPRLEALWVLDRPGATAPLGYRSEPLPPLEAPVEAADVGPGDTLVILYTSGTTGVSKGVCSPHAQYYWFATLTGESLGVREDDVLFTCLPLFHVNALHSFFTALALGATYVVERRFSASRFWAQARDCGATVTFLLGAMLHILLSREPDPGDRDHAIRIALGGGAPPTTSERFSDRFGIVLWNGYGSTETNCVIGTPLDDVRPGYMGVALPEFDVEVVDAQDAVVPDGSEGELVIRPREPFTLSTGYFDMPEKTAEAWRNLWFHTGDTVVREPDGWFRFVDRMKDALRRRGENISSQEVEAVLVAHPAVRMAAVFGIASALSEDEVMAAITLEEGTALEPVDLMAHCEPRLAHFAIPRYVDVVDELPLTENGKVRKHVLRERGVTPTTWDREAAGYAVKRPGRAA